MRALATPLLAGVLLAACALSPQIVSIRPVLEAGGERSIGQQAIVALSVLDTRTSTIIGQRGGIYERTATISTEGDITGPVRGELAKILQALNFAVVEPGGPADVTLTVHIERIAYAAWGGDFVRGVRTDASVRVAAERGSRTFTGTYRGNHEKDTLTAPNAEENEALINAAISKVLQRVVSDAELLRFMAGG
jgi:uncharacterized lipoprotein